MAKKPTVVHYAARGMLFMGADVTPGDEIDPTLIEPHKLRRLLNSGYLVCEIDGVPTRKSRQYMRRVRARRARGALETGAHKKAVARSMAAQAAAGGRGNTASSSHGGDGSSKPKAAGVSRKTAAPKVATKPTATKKKTNGKKKRTRRGA